ncbi:efflux RND transporter permease subunit [Hydrocarboniclastica marina]|uniref:AcrB/AcrD/AcrF family protein n=1 Tax=Hydrocarboniclastica marina TaxID=2259620 RepID=A0A4P7XCQ9_9ALTE|nr:efflux RND transporter permease subunit [Hydrocarboniclastica marina]QCF24639.1 AcrB/AcrD/AcrF family protein [Hydrocarboniclastica marina]
MADPKGWLDHIVGHRVGPNLLMIVLIFGGIFMSTKITQEVFPEFQVDSISVAVSYPGATPEQIEQGVILPIEEAVRGIPGIEQISSVAREGSGQVTLELVTGAQTQQVYQDVEQQVNRIETFPDNAEQPSVTLHRWYPDVLDLVIYGDVSDQTLRNASEQILDRLLLLPEITRAELESVPAREIHIEIDESQLRRLGLSFEQVAAAVSVNARDRSAGSVETVSGDLLLQVHSRREDAQGFASVPVVTGADGTLIRLGDIATLRDGFEVQREEISTFNGYPALEIGVLRVGEQTPQSVSKAVREALPEIMREYPPALQYAVQSDRSEVYQQRLQLLLQNGFLGLLLVFLLLTLFLEFKLAFWVTVGIPTSFLGALLFLPGMGVSINMISLFAFIVALGIVVDDAIVAGENIYEYRQRGYSFAEAAVLGAREISVPIIFAVLTNIVAFMPLMFMPGGFGQLWAVIPAVVSTVFAISLLEALVILPAHLGHVRDRHSNPITARLHRIQQTFSNGFSRLVERVYGPFLSRAIRVRYFTVACCVAILVVTLSYAFSGRLGFTLMPRVENDQAEATAVMAEGTPMSELTRVRDQLVGAAQELIDQTGGDDLSQGIYAEIEGSTVEVRVYLTPPDLRPLSTGEFAQRWRAVTGPVTGVDYVRFSSDRGGPGGGAAVTVDISHPDTEVLAAASQALAERLETVAGVSDVDDGYQPGKRQWSLTLNETGTALGLSANDLGRQVRAAVLGEEALTLLRGRNEVTVRVRLPGGEKQSEVMIEGFMLQTPQGKYVPLAEVADIVPGRALSSISRQDGRRTLTVSANVEPVGQTNQVLATLTDKLMPALQKDFPGLAYSFEGRQADMRDAVDSFFQSVTLALLGIYALLAIPFRSYSQPLIIMFAIPFGVVGAILGHVVMGYSLSLISIMGMIALGGIVVNDSLVMIDYANRRRQEGLSALESIYLAGVRRFRPILLTTMTTFGGLAPMIFETSRQARFMIPLAISLGFGILVATAILLLLVPCVYLILEDVKALFGGRAANEADAAQPSRSIVDLEQI